MRASEWRTKSPYPIVSSQGRVFPGYLGVGAVSLERAVFEAKEYVRLRGFDRNSNLGAKLPLRSLRN